MQHFQAAQVVDCQNSLGETPRWHSGEQALYWVDIRATTINRLHPSSGSQQTWKLPDLCGGLVIARDGLVVAMRRHLARFNPHDGSLVSLVDVEPAALDNRLNEMRCDPQGRIWIGSMRDFGTATTGSVYQIVSQVVV